MAEALNIPASLVSRSLPLLELPETIQQQVDVGAIPARSAYEISKVKDDAKQLKLARKVAGGMTLKETKDAVGLRRSSKRKKDRAKRLKFSSDHGWKIVAIAPTDKKQRTYYGLKDALGEVQEELEIRIANNVRVD